ncbi:terminase TerL endonuclease subunit [Albibacillus kandeliae]|uniref:terminase TerL endonuclease subunit n=1 Tax=Albibacillus kandeliae TaxID=2174228 RepID=UPI0013007AFA|nr:terminase TerL endonuclease subunit [Albibacillus kandeliae]
MTLKLSKTLKKKRPTTDADLLAEWLADSFIVPAGISRGQPLLLHSFQLGFLEDHLARDPEDGGPLFRTSVLSTPRKLGKTTLASALVLGRMCEDSPIFLPNFRGAITAPTEGHALIVPQNAIALLEAVERDDLKLRKTPAPGYLSGPKGGHFAILTGSKTQGHGQDLDLAIVDEAGLLPRQSETLQNVFDATAARDGSVLLTGTRGDAPEYNEIINNPDRRTAVHLYAADKEDDPADPKVWAKANPGLGKIKSRRFMEDAYEKAAKSGSTVEFQVWQLNAPLSPTRQLLLEYQTLSRAYDEEAKPIPGESCFVGLDLGGSASMTAATIVFEQSGVIQTLGAFPSAELDLYARGKRDMVGTTWVDCAARGELFETSGAVTDVAEFLEELAKRIGPHPVLSLSCDRYRDAECRTAMARAKLVWPLKYRGTGPKDGDNDIRATRRMFLSGKAKLKRSLLLEASMGEADVKVAATGSMQLDKSHPHARIDVAQSLVLACSAYISNSDAPPPEYEVTVI